MDFIPSVAYLLAAFVCSLVGRALLIKAAMGVSKGWGVAVMLAPFGPFFFRRKYQELALAGQYWRLATTLFVVAFFVLGSGDVEGELEKLLPGSKSAEIADSGAGDDNPEGDDQDGHELVSAIMASASATAAASPTPPPAASGSIVERVAANQREFLRLNQVFEDLTKERGYLRKGNAEDLAAYNAAAAKYQAALAAARAEQAELNKQLTVARK